MSKAMGEKELVLALRAQGASAAEARDLALVAGALALVPDPEIDAAFADALEARLLAEPVGETEGTSTVVTPIRRTIVLPEARPAVAPAQKPKVAAVIPLPRRRHTMRRTLAVAIAAAMLLALPIAASANSLPTSPFYRLKIGLEQLRLHFTHGDISKGFYELDRAGTRLGEADQLAELGDNTHVKQVLSMMRASQRHGSSLIQGGSPSPAELARLRSMLLGYAEQLATLLPQLNSSARSSALATIRQSESIASTLAPSLSLAVAGMKLPQASAAAPATIDQSGGSTTTPSGTDAGSGDSDITKDPSGSTTRRVHDGADAGCSVPGSANGLGDLAAPLAKVVCH